MNLADSERILKLRLNLTEQRYSQETIAAWAQALEDVTEHDAARAARALANDGHTNITVPAIRGWLKDEHATKARWESSQTGTGLTDLAFAVMQPELVEARREWWINGAHGHYPDCPCDTCRRRTL